MREISISNSNGVSVGTGTVDRYGGIECAAVLGGDQDTAELIYDAIEAAIADGETEGTTDGYRWRVEGEDGSLVMGCRVQWDASGGQGHCWRVKHADDLPTDIREEIEGEIIDGREECDDYVASNGQHYRWF